MRKNSFVLTSLIALLAACDSGSSTSSSSKSQLGTFGIDMAQMDTAVRPGEDFYRYVNGNWLQTFTIPPDKARYGMFSFLADKADLDVRAILEDLGKKEQPAGSVQQKVSDLFNSWMDTTTIETLGIKPLEADFARINAANSKSDIEKLMGEIDYASPFAYYIFPDPADPTRYTVGITQSGLAMPNRDYYLSKGDRFDAYRAAYKNYVTKIFSLIGDADAAKSADAVIALETRIAQVHWPEERRRNIKETYNPVDRAGLRKMLPSADWDAILQIAGLGAAQNFVVGEVSALRDGVRLLDSTPVETWKKYLAFHLANLYADKLPKTFDQARFEFQEKTLQGVEQMRDRWKRGVALVNERVGEAVGELYVAKHFPPASKASMDALVINLRSAMAERLKSLEWIDDSTRAEALKKLETFESRVGYPNKWRDYSKLTVAAGKLLENTRSTAKFDWERQVARLGQPVDRDEWEMNPQTVNAYYNPLMNQITFPAAILQPPFFDVNADPAVNYGGIGAVIGHEIGHGFDDQGREFDEKGKLRNWWTAATNAKFEKATTALAAQYDAYCPLEGVCVNGRFTMGENIGDLGGLEMAYSAYRLSLKGEEPAVLGGLTGDQRFFISHAQIWRSKDRDNEIRSRIIRDPHSPPSARGRIPEQNIDAWYAAFGVKEGDKLFFAPEKRVRIW